jgi:SAM-dependent methyltransferase
MIMNDDKDIKKKVRENYARIARGEKTHYTTSETSCCGSEDISCCGSNAPSELSKSIGYSDEEMGEVPDGANLGLGCGNPVALASLSEGETVLDLGSGAGFDCFLAANRVGSNGRVIGVDMTDDMLEKARENAEKGGYGNVEFRKGFIEELPVDDDEVDAIISNCVINLSPEKDKVFEESLRVLKPGGRLMVSDLVLKRELPAEIRASVTAYVGCVSGADIRGIYLERIRKAGFERIEIVDESTFPLDCLANDTTIDELLEETGLSKKALAEALEDVSSVKVSAYKPAR